MEEFDIKYKNNYHLAKGKWFNESRIEDTITEELENNNFKNVEFLEKESNPVFRFYSGSADHLIAQCQDYSNHYYSFTLRFYYGYPKTSIFVTIWSSEVVMKTLVDFANQYISIYKSLGKALNKIQIDKPAVEIEERLAEILEKGKLK